eukprot:2605295-Prorocentrum_lima.AAC.1
MFGVHIGRGVKTQCTHHAGGHVSRQDATTTPSPSRALELCDLTSSRFPVRAGAERALHGWTQQALHRIEGCLLQPGCCVPLLSRLTL